MNHLRLEPSRADDEFLNWYEAIILAAELADYGPVEGTMIMRPYGYGFWEQIKAQLAARIKSTGAQNVYFPVFIPRSNLDRVPEIQEMASELAIVTHAGGAELPEPLMVRFSSETVIGDSLSKWVRSYRDLPVLLNQWANVVRWERNPSLFMRTNEFLWQEGHTMHSSEMEARSFARRIQRDVYEDLIVNAMAIPAVAGIKSRRQRSGGPTLNTFTCEAMMGDGKALQIGTSIEAGQTFANAFNIRYLSAGGRQETPWTTSWGASTRLIGGAIMVHGDGDGLRMPPVVAPVQATVVAVEDQGLPYAHAIAAELRQAGLRVAIDERVEMAPDKRRREWVLKGVPALIEVRPQHGDASGVTLVPRSSVQHIPLPRLGGLSKEVVRLLDEEQRTMLHAARLRRDSRIAAVTTTSQVVDAVEGGWAKMPWSALGDDGEQELAKKAITVRCLQREDGSTPDDDLEPDLVAFIARSH